MAADPGSLGGAGQRAHAPADPGGPGGAPLPRLPRPVSRRRHLRRAPPVGAVVDAWAGLGYNRRAVYLHRAARGRRRAPRRRAARPPRPAAWPSPASGRTRPGPCWPSPSNATTGWSRPTSPGCWPGPSAGRRLTAREAQSCADGLVPAGKAWSWNQAMVDLGATVCVTRAPRCDAVPAGRRRTVRLVRAGPPGPDPARGSAGTSGRQSPFAGSDRQGRGRLVDAMRRRTVAARTAGRGGRLARRPGPGRPGGGRPGGRRPGRERSGRPRLFPGDRRRQLETSVTPMRPDRAAGGNLKSVRGKFLADHVLWRQGLVPLPISTEPALRRATPPARCSRCLGSRRSSSTSVRGCGATESVSRRTDPSPAPPW